VAKRHVGGGGGKKKKGGGVSPTTYLKMRVPEKNRPGT